MAGMRYLKKQLDKSFIKGNAWIVGEMQRHYKEYGRPDRGAGRMCLILRLFIDFAVLRKNPVRIKQKRLERQIYPESVRKRQISRQEMTDAIKDKNIVIFDLWNVLVCPVLDAAKLSALFETVTGCPGISGYTDFNSEKDNSAQEPEMRSRIEEIFMDFCMDNEYMHHIWDEAKDMGKRVYLYNNSDFQDIFARKIAEKFGYAGEVYHGDTSAGSYITADCKKKKGIGYRNVNEVGEDYRPFLHTNIVTDFYNRYVNMKFHAGWSARSIFYEYGFACGGILVCGFCQYLNELAAQKDIDKLLFVSRDGDIIKKVYDRYYKKCDTTYLVFSRSASYELIFEDFPEEYIEKNIRIRMHSGRYTIREILYACGLVCLDAYLDEQDLSPAEELNDNNYRQFREFLLQHKDRAAEAFRDSETAAKKYFMKERHTV